MRRHISHIVAIVAIALPVFLVSPAHSARPVQAASEPSCSEASLYCPVQKSETLSQTLTSLAAPNLADAPPKPVTPPSATAGNAKTRIVTYDVATRGNISADFNQFRVQVGETLSDNRGWSRLGVTFQQVSSGGQFTVVLTEASQVPSFAADCDAAYSCAVGRYVIINQDRWLNATPSWNSSGGSLRDYRHMVVNHETGHWLGHGHEQCGGAGQPAPVMQQQSISLQGCVFNPWPLSHELHSAKLGI